MRLGQSHVRVFMKRGFMGNNESNASTNLSRGGLWDITPLQVANEMLPRKVRCSQKLVMYRGNHFCQCIVLCFMNQRWSLSPRQKTLTIVPSIVEKSGSKLFEQVICIKMNGTNSLTKKITRRHVY
jgi:hypothetical protein